MLTSYDIADVYATRHDVNAQWKSLGLRPLVCTTEAYGTLVRSRWQERANDQGSATLGLDAVEG